MTDQPEAGPERADSTPVPGPAAAAGGVFGARVPAPRAYPGQDTDEHARRLLRRAVNADRPGEDTLLRLVAAQGYDIERLPEPCQVTSRAWCSVYEHAFLLADDSELCLYELEHDLTPDRSLVSEVYPDEVAAGQAARRRARARDGA